MKQKIRHIFSTFLTVVMLYTLVIPAFAAGSMAYILTANGEENCIAETGDIVTVSFSLQTEDQLSLITLQNEIEYDTNFFELVSDSMQTAETGSIFHDVRTTGQHIIKCSMFASNGMSMSGEREFASFQLKVIATSGTSEIRCSEAYAHEKNESVTLTTRNATVSIGTAEQAAQYTVHYNANGGSGTMPDQTFTYGQAQELIQNAFTRDGYTFSGWATSADGATVYQNRQSVINLTDVNGATVNLYAIWVQNQATANNTVGIIVMDSNTNERVSDATVTLQQGNDILATAIYNAALGLYEFRNINSGIYNLVATEREANGNRVVTYIARWATSVPYGDTITLTFPPGTVSSKLSVNESTDPNVIASTLNTSKTVVGNLDLEATSHQQEDSNIEVTLYVEAKSESQVLNDPIQRPAAEALKTVIENTARAAGRNTNITQTIFLQLDAFVINRTTAGAETNQNALSETNHVIEIIIPFNMMEKINLGIFHYHNNEATALVPLSSLNANPVNGTFYFDSAHGLIHIFTSRFSLYAISYDDNPRGGASSGGSSGGGGGGGGGSSSSISTYLVTITQPENGTLTSSASRASSGSTVTITATPNSGYELDNITVLDSSHKEVTLIRSGNTCTFTMPASSVIVSGTFKTAAGTQPNNDGETTPAPENAFTDVLPEQYFYNAVQWAVEHGITNGKSPTIFAPYASCTRANMVTFLWRAAGSPQPETTENPFSDVIAGKYYYNAILWAAENKITLGTTDTTFTPDKIVTRAQAVTFLYRMDGTEPTIDNPFTDVPETKYYYNSVLWAYENGITKGTSNTTFSPDEPCLRSQIVAFLYRKFTGNRA